MNSKSRRRLTSIIHFSIFIIHYSLRPLMPHGMAFLRNARVAVVSLPYTLHCSASLIVGDGDHTVPKPDSSAAVRKNGSFDSLRSLRMTRFVRFCVKQGNGFFGAACLKCGFVENPSVKFL